MKHFDPLALALPLAALFLTGGPPAAADNFGFGGSPLKAHLSGFQEVPSSLFSPGSGAFLARIDHGSIQFILSYDGLENEVTQAHIHFSQRHTNGGIVAFLCTNLAPPDDVPLPQPCPATEGQVKGAITAEHIFGGAAAQGIVAGEFDKLLEAILAGAAYVNVHTTAFPAGELRGQIKSLRPLRR